MSEEESDYGFEYEILSTGSAEPWDNTNNRWFSASGTTSTSNAEGSVSQGNSNSSGDLENENKCNGKVTHPSTSTAASHDNNDEIVAQHLEEHKQAAKPDETTHFDFDELKHFMSEIGNVHDSLG